MSWFSQQMTAGSFLLFHFDRFFLVVRVMAQTCACVWSPVWPDIRTAGPAHVPAGPVVSQITIYHFRMFYGPLPPIFLTIFCSTSHPWKRSSDSCWDRADTEQTDKRTSSVISDICAFVLLLPCTSSPEDVAVACWIRSEAKFLGRDDELWPRKKQLKTKNSSGATERYIHHRQARKWMEFLEREDKQTSFKNTVSHQLLVHG